MGFRLRFSRLNQSNDPPFLLLQTTEVEVLSLPLRSPFTGDDAGCLGRLAAHCLGLGGQEREAHVGAEMCGV